MKAEFSKIFGILGIPTSIIFPILIAQDKDLKVITFEGSGSLFEPIQSLTKDSKAIVSIIPTGSSGGREALEEGLSDFALASLSKVETQQEGKYQEARLADDPISLIYKSNTKCEALTNNNYQASDNNSDLLEKLLRRESGCKDLVFFVREGGLERSNLNKTVFKQDIDKGIEVVEIAENNFLALERFRLNHGLDAVIFLPSSFYEQNKNDWLFGYSEIKLQGASVQSTSPKQKELNLVFEKGKINAGEDGLKDFFTKLLLKTKDLKESFQLKPQDYCQSNGSEGGDCNETSQEGKATDIKKILGGGG